MPFRLVPVCFLEESTATSVWNLNSLKKAAQLDTVDGYTSTTAQTLVSRFDVEDEIDYGSWARDNILPRWKKMETRPVWQEEMKSSGERINNTAVEIN